MDRLSPTLRVLGAPTLHGPDGEPITFRTRKHFALLIYLALEPQTHRREKLGALLWPSATTAESRHSLATGLSVLRARLGRERLETTRDTARLIPGELEIDLDRLARGEIHSTDTAPALAVAPLLQEFVVADAGPWDQWRDALTARWQPAIRDALLARIERSRRQGNTRAMESLADALLQLDDLSEDGIRAKMEARAFAGDRLTALQQYEAWRVRLADELGAQPSELVAGMALRLRRRGWERTSGEHIPAVRTDQWKDRYFVGRAKEYEALYGGWEGCQRGVPRHVLLTGESGVGKSTLVERLTTAAGLQGAVAARIQCHEVEREIPYGAIGGLIALLLDRPGATAVAPEWLSELSRTVSAVRRKFPNVAPPQEATGEMVRIRLADAFHELVRAIAEEQPLILVMDDIHLSDDASVAVMHLLLRRLTDERLLVICTLRQGDGSLAPSARGMLERAEVAQMSVVPLLPLSESESAELLAHLVPGEVTLPPSTVRRALLRAGGGLPMLLELLVVDWLAHGNRCVALAVEAMTEEPGAAGGAGVTYRRLLDRLTGGLDAITRSVLHLAAILGSQLNEFELYSLVDLTLAQAMSGLSHLATLRIMRDSGHGLEFMNEVMRGEVYLAVPSSVRRVLHSQVADRLIERQAAGEEMLGLAIAWHCMRSGRVQEAGEWLIKGGTEAIARSALAEAEEALASGFRNLTGPATSACGVLLGEVLLDQARYDDARGLALKVAALPHPADASRISQLLRMTALGLTLHRTASHDATLSDLLAIVDSTARAEDQMRAAVMATTVASYSHSPVHRQLTLDTLSRASDASRGRIRDRFDLLIAQLHYWQRDLDTAEGILARLGMDADADGPSLLSYNLQLGLGTCLVARGQYRASTIPASRAARLAFLAGATIKEIAATSNLSVSMLRLGDLESALTLAKGARRLGLGLDRSTTAATVYGVELVCLALTNRVADFRTLLAEARSFPLEEMSPPVKAVFRLWLADSQWLAGDHHQAILDAALALDTVTEATPGSLGVACRWASVLHDTRPTAVTEAMLLRGVVQIERADVLDRYEIALAALRSLLLTADERHHLQDTAMAASELLPPSAIQLIGRLGLAGHRLPQNPHPTA